MCECPVKFVERGNPIERLGLGADVFEEKALKGALLCGWVCVDDRWRVERAIVAVAGEDALFFRKKRG